MATRTRIYVNSETYKGYVWVGPNGGVWDSPEGGTRLGEQRPNGTIAFTNTSPVGDRTALDPETYVPPPLTVELGPTDPEAPASERPEKPTSPLPAGWTWEWSDDAQAWTPTEGEAPVNQKAREDLRAAFKNYLATYGLDTPGMVGLVEKAVANDWSIDKFLLEMRQSPDYLANPLFAANLERVKQGKRFMAEGEILQWRDEAKRLAKQYGYKEPSDNYLAQGLQSGLSMAEIEHRYSVQKNVNEMGAGVRWVYENILGANITDEDLYEIFDPEFDTAEFDEAYKNALYRGRPMALGLGVRSQAEADAFKMLGVDPGEAFKRYEGLQANASRFQRLGAIEDLITQGLPDDFGNFSTEENSTLVRALLFNDQEALAKMQNVVSREIARFKTGAGVQATQGQLTGLLSGAERQTYG